MMNVDNPSPKTSSRLSWLASMNAVGAFLIGGLGLLPYITGLPFSKAGQLPMAPSTAVSFLLLSSLAFSLVWPTPHFGERWSGTVAAGLVAAYGFLVFLGWATPWPVNPEDWLVPDLGSEAGYPIGHMSPVTGVLFLSSGFSLTALVRCGTDRWFSAAGFIGATVAFSGLLFTLAYLTDAPLLYGGGIIPIALSTAFAFSFLGASLAIHARLRSSDQAAWVRVWKSLDVAREPRTGFAGLVLVILVLGGFAWRQTVALWHWTEALHEQLLGVRLPVDQLRVDLLGVELESRKLLGAVDPPDQQAARARRDAYAADAKQQFARLAAHYRGAHTELDAAREAYLKWSTLEQEPQEPVPTGSPEGGQQRGDEIERARVLLRSHMETLGDFARREAARHFHEASRVEQRLHRQLVIILTSSLVLSLLIARGIDNAFTTRRRAERSLREQNEKNRALLRYASDGIHVLDRDGNLIEASDSFCTMLGYRRDELLGMPLSLWDAQFTDTELKAGLKRRFDQSSRSTFETRHRRKDGSVFDVEVSTNPLTLEGQAILFSSSRDITERKQSERSLQRLNRLYAVLSHSNQAIVRCGTAPDLFQEVCYIAVDHGGFLFARVDLIAPESRTLHCVAKAGQDQADVADLPWAMDQAIRRGEPAIRQDRIPDSAPAAPREANRESSSAASGIFPIRQGAEVIGALTLYASEPTYFIDDALGTLREMVTDLSHALEQFDREAQRRTAVQSLRESEERFRHISSCISDVAYSCSSTADGVYEIDWITGAVTRVTGYSADEIEARDGWRHLVHADDLDCFNQHVVGLSPGSSSSCEMRLRHKSGQVVWVASFAECVPDSQQPERTRLYGALIDITARHEAEERLRLNAAVMASTRDGVVITDLGGCILAVNRAYTEITGYGEAELLGQNPRLLKSGLHDESFYQTLWATLLTSGNWQGEVWNRRKNGEVYPEWLTLSTVCDPDGQPTHYVAVATDISQLKQSELRLEHLAHFDPLTDLPNRTLVQFRLEHALQRAHRGNHQVGVLFIDLDRFKTINDSLGHSTGDVLLREASQRLRERVRESDTIGRLGGDEFLVALEQIRSSEEAAAVASALLATLEAPFVLPHGREVYIRASIGISLYPEDGRTPEELIRNADAAMYQVKESGRNAYGYYTQALTAAANEHLELESRLRRAVKQQEFILCYQPLVSVADGRLLGAEALVRWQPPDGPLVSPADFIPLAEETGLIVPLGEWVLREACTQAKIWQDAGLSFEQVAINLSVRQFHHPDLERTVRSVLAETGLSPDCLDLEITESSLMGTGEQAVANLRGIKAMGLRLSIDDFGTGYSSLAYLKRLPLDRLKIDYRFIHDIPDDPNDVAIASTIIAMAHTLGLQAVAEGVETEAQLDFLRREGCDAFQGYLYSAPLPAEEFARRFLRMR